MASLTDKTIDQTYAGLIKTEDNAALNSTPKSLTDGLGNQTGIKLKGDGSGDIISDGNVTAIAFYGDGSNLTGVVSSSTLQQVTDNGSTTTNSVTLGGLTASGNTYPTTLGQNGQAIVTDGAGNLSFADVSGSGGVTSVNSLVGDITLVGGTGVTVTSLGTQITIDSSASSNPTLQEVTTQGSVTTDSIEVGGLTVTSDSLQVGNIKLSDANVNTVRIGQSQASITSDAVNNTSVGSLSLQNISTADNNTAVGYFALNNVSTGGFNTAIGSQALNTVSLGIQNTAIGFNALATNSGSGNTAIGNNAGALDANNFNNTSSTDGVYIGNGTRSLNINQVNEIVIGSNAIGYGTNTASYGNGNITRHVFTSGWIEAQDVYSTTTADAANVNVGITGILRRSTSSLKYKENVSDYDKGLEVIDTLRPVYYESKNGDGKQYAGLIAEEVHEAGLSEFVQYDVDGQPDALAYQNMVSLLIKGMQELKAEVEQLKAKINA